MKTILKFDEIKDSEKILEEPKIFTKIISTLSIVFGTRLTDWK